MGRDGESTCANQRERKGRISRIRKGFGGKAKGAFPMFGKGFGGKEKEDFSPQMAKDATKDSREINSGKKDRDMAARDPDQYFMGRVIFAMNRVIQVEAAPKLDEDAQEIAKDVESKDTKPRNAQKD